LKLPSVPFEPEVSEEVVNAYVAHA
jgi:hypothetical protein